MLEWPKSWVVGAYFQPGGIMKRSGDRMLTALPHTIPLSAPTPGLGMWRGEESLCACTTQNTRLRAL